jgi:hypothetical protein
MMTRVRLCAGGVLAALMLSASVQAQAAASLRNEMQLGLALRSSPPCCVIDARAESERKALALDEALVYPEDLRIKPTATVVVVADNDEAALAVAESIAAAHPGSPVLAVEGGVVAWQRVLARINAEPPGGRAIQFVIPKNTCEHGPALQQLRIAPQ